MDGMIDFSNLLRKNLTKEIASGKMPSKEGLELAFSGDEEASDDYKFFIHLYALISQMLMTLEIQDIEKHVIEKCNAVELDPSDCKRYRDLILAEDQVYLLIYAIAVATLNRITEELSLELNPASADITYKPNGIDYIVKPSLQGVDLPSVMANQLATVVIDFYYSIVDSANLEAELVASIISEMDIVIEDDSVEARLREAHKFASFVLAFIVPTLCYMRVINNQTVIDWANKYELVEDSTADEIVEAAKDYFCEE